MSEPGFSIKIAAQRSGLTPHIIRAWEKRYGAVSPGRTGTQRRRYSQQEIDRLSLLRHVTFAGHSIGTVANLPDDSLRELVRQDSTPPETPARKPEPAPIAIDQMLDEAFAAVASLDARQLESILHSALVKVGRTAVMHRMLVPLIHRIGDAWQTGELRVAHEHIASAVIRTFLGNFVRSHSGTANAPVLLVTTPSGQLHELGALLVAASASDQGWDVTYLGPNLPAEEVAGAFIQNKAHAIAISIVYPADDTTLPNQLRLMRELLPPHTPILVGGHSASAYRHTLESIGAILCTDISSFIEDLARIRRQRRADPVSENEA